MHTNLINHSFLKMTISEKILFGTRISSCMREADDIFKTPIVELSELDKIISHIVASLIMLNHESNDSFKRALLFQDEAQLDKHLRLLARYVERVANGNKNLAQKSGFQIKAEARVLNGFNIFNRTRMFLR